MRICKLGEEVLSQTCEEVKAEEIDDNFRKLLNEMFETMISANGVGLAAPQIGVAKRFFVLMADDDVKRVFINPQIIKTSAETSSYDEGCLSIPGESESIIRPVKVSVTALNEKGKRFTIEDADGLLARIIQHENDHLNGILYIDRGDETVKKNIIEKFKKRAEKNAAKAAAKAAKKASLEAKLALKQKKGN